MDNIDIENYRETGGRRLIIYITIVSVFVFFLLSAILLFTTYIITVETYGIKKNYILLLVVPAAVFLSLGFLIFFVHKLIDIPLKKLKEFTDLAFEDQVDDISNEKCSIKEINQIGYAISKMVRIISENQEDIRNTQCIAKIGTWKWDIEDNSFSCSRQVYFIFELQPESSVSIDLIMSMVYDDDKDFVRESLDSSVNEGNNQNIDHRIITETGKVLWVHHIITVLKESSGKTFKIIGTIQDITDRKSIEEELTEYRENLELKVSERTIKLSEMNKKLKSGIKERELVEEDLIKAKKAADEANITKSRFLANMSHEIRTPMNSILGYIDLSLENKNIDQEIKENLLIAANSANSLLRLLNDILDISKMEEGKLEFNIARFSLKRMLKNVLLSFKAEALKKDIEINLIHHPALQNCYLGDEARISQIFINIIGNAVKFTDRGSVTVTIETLDANKIRFSVKDTGIGIQEKDIGRIMEPFTQADISSKRKFGGSGLGLSIARQIIAMMGGELEIQSTPGKGSVFSYTLEMEEAECSRNCLNECGFKYTENDETISYSKNLKILLAEDVAANAKLAELRLKKYGHTVHHVWNGKEALAKIENENFDIVLLDVQMPVMNGLETVKRLRTREQEKKIKERIPVIALTASVMKEDIEEFLKAGINTVVAKPVNFPFLMDEIDRLLPGKSREVIKFVNKDEIKGLDISGGLELWRDKDAYFEALDLFFKEKTEELNNLKESFEKSDLSKLGIIVHRLTGICGNLSLYGMHSILLNLIEKIREEDKNGIYFLINKLEEEFDVVSKEIKNLTGIKKGNKESNKKKLGRRKLKAMLDLLIDAIEQDELIVAESVINGLSEYIDETHFENLKDALKHFDFIKAKNETFYIAESLNISIGGT